MKHLIIPKIALAVFLLTPIVTGTDMNTLNETNTDNLLKPTLMKQMIVTDNNPLKLIRCYCNIPECMALPGSDQTCMTRLGCFSKLEPNLPTMEDAATTTLTSGSINDMIPDVFPKDTVVSIDELKGSFGCLDYIPTNQTCDEVLKLMEGLESEFPALETTATETNENRYKAYSCCQYDMCNDRVQVAASALAVQAALVTAYAKSMIKDEPTNLKAISINSSNLVSMNDTITSKNVNIQSAADKESENHIGITSTLPNSIEWSLAGTTIATAGLTMDFISENPTTSNVNEVEVNNSDTTFGPEVLTTTKTVEFAKKEMTSRSLVNIILGRYKKAESEIRENVQKESIFGDINSSKSVWNSDLLPLPISRYNNESRVHHHSTARSTYSRIQATPKIFVHGTGIGLQD